MRRRGTTVASIQRSYDERINIGELYKCGSAILMCSNRTDPFISEVDFNKSDARDVTAEFTVIEGGEIWEWDEDRLNYDWTKLEKPDLDFQVGVICSKYAQMYQLLVASFSVERAFKTIEVGLQSNVALKSSGIPNFNSLVKREDKISGLSGVPDNSYQAYIDSEYCGGFEGNKDGSEDEAYRKEIIAGKYSGQDTRYSFFRILYRENDDSGQTFTASDHLYGVRSVTGVDAYNYIRFKFTDSKRREFRFMPITSYEIREDIAKGDLYFIDAHEQGAEKTVAENGFTVQFKGDQIARSSDSFELKAFLIQTQTRSSYRVRRTTTMPTRATWTAGHALPRHSSTTASARPPAAGTPDLVRKRH